ncbi:unnamed protein product [Bursaphelenchus xylophilus]|uniref:(pine wood nematode) hypothetical protein n=1 Tax=Bursaphelenchus xylophilus TaxID=6326 RepID=A0A1I7SEK1_BURXY|nr:unnamed protein product [Bursaphelenchus xylophilus]CAG9113581.1 unnamed protein product [Bursaphelenchus xylophilus]
MRGKVLCMGKTWGPDDVIKVQLIEKYEGRGMMTKYSIISNQPHWDGNNWFRLRGARNNDARAMIKVTHLCGSHGPARKCREAHIYKTETETELNNNGEERPWEYCAQGN